jgi:uncharacterized protein (DUF934 family)
MGQLIRQRELVVDEWRAAGDDAQAAAVIIPLAQWRTEREQWLVLGKRLGVRIAPADRVETLEPDLEHLALVAIEFTGPGEGRGYSQARVLRERFHFRGEIRAVGHVKRDQLFFMSRCGFDAFELSAGEDARQALAAFEDYSVAYQPASERFTTLRRRV